MAFKKYRKIHRLGSEENEGILLGKVLVQEKIDGANTSLWFEDGWIRCGSRSQDVTAGSFNGFVEYVHKHEGLKKFFEDFPNMRLYGEWLCRHTISYKETAYKQWYLFDFEDRLLDATPGDEVKSKYENPGTIYEIAGEYGLNTPQNFGTFENPTVEQIMEFVGKSNLGDKGEGVVLKNFDFVNKFGDQEYAKIVTQNFKEDNALVFGGNNKHSDTYWEMWVVNKYMTVARIQKIMNKIQPLEEKRLSMHHTARIINTAWHDLITEEIWDITKKVQKLDMKKLAHLCTRKAAQIYKDIIEDNLSVADIK